TGGEYRVWTELHPVDSAVKQYGGAGGFPFWVDWKPAETVFVSAGGSSSNSGLSAAQPVRQIAQALEIAHTSGRPHVIVTNGSFDGFAIDGSGDGNNRTTTGGHNPL